MSKCICSIAIDGDKELDIPITKNPGGAKSFSIKKRRALFYLDSLGKYQIPENRSRVSFPDYHEHVKNVNYGEPVYT